MPFRCAEKSMNGGPLRVIYAIFIHVAAFPRGAKVDRPKNPSRRFAMQ